MNSWARTGAAAVGIALAASSCAGVPDSGPVRIGRPVAAAGGGLAAASVREVPAGPAPGASPVDVVSGFLRAMVNSDGGYGIARSYLAPGASWNSGSGITIYADPGRVVRVGRGLVVLHAERVGVVGPHGVYQVDPGRISPRFRLVRRDGEWRIAKLDAGVLMSSDDAGRVLQPTVLYFVNPAGDRVVPEPVLEPPQEPGLATTLMRALVAGPGPLIAPGVRTAVPPGTTLIGNVPISADGVAEVDLSAGARQISSSQLERLSAQVVWTLRQLSSVTAVRLFANGTPLEAPGVPQEQPVRMWLQYEPAAPPVATGAWLVRHGRVVGLGGAVVPSVVPVGSIVSATRSADGSVIAVVRRNGRQETLLTGPATAPLRARVHDASLSVPTFGPNGLVLVAASNGVIDVVEANGNVRQAHLPGQVAGARVRALAMSSDGTRLAAVVTTLSGSALEVATVDLAGNQLSLREPRVVLPASSDVAGVSWVDANLLVTTVSVGEGRRGVVEVGPDGYQVQALTELGLAPDPDAVAAGPGQRVLAADPGGTWQLLGRRWHRVADGSVPTYAGG